MTDERRHPPVDPFRCVCPPTHPSPRIPLNAGCIWPPHWAMSRLLGAVDRNPYRATYGSWTVASGITARAVFPPRCSRKGPWLALASTGIVAGQPLARENAGGFATGHCRGPLCRKQLACRRFVRRLSLRTGPGSGRVFAAGRGPPYQVLSSTTRSWSFAHTGPAGSSITTSRRVQPPGPDRPGAWIVGRMTGSGDYFEAARHFTAGCSVAERRRIGRRIRRCEPGWRERDL